jgi:orotidine-5'-phosphate decarboxylase
VNGSFTIAANDLHPHLHPHPTGSTMNDSPICFALDYARVEEARAAAARVRDAVGMVKVGLELFVEAGPKAVGIGAEIGLPVFLDLKLHDIPETVERAVARAAALGAKVLTIHAGGGPAMCGRAAARAAKEGTGLVIAAVTVLTSLDAGDLAKLGVGEDVPSHARRLARLAFDEGVRAFVCSPHEVKAMRAELGPEATLITPGVRPSDAAGKDDQKRVATASRAIADGADWLVVGRPIRDAPDPLAAAGALRDEARRALAAR